jgi:hypothetical protein
MPFFILTAVKTSNLTSMYFFPVETTKTEINLTDINQSLCEQSNNRKEAAASLK